MNETGIGENNTNEGPQPSLEKIASRPSSVAAGILSLILTCPIFYSNPASAGGQIVKKAFNIGGDNKKEVISVDPSTGKIEDIEGDDLEFLTEKTLDTNYGEKQVCVVQINDGLYAVYRNKSGKFRKFILKESKKNKGFFEIGRTVDINSGENYIVVFDSKEREIKKIQLSESKKKEKAAKRPSGKDIKKEKKGTEQEKKYLAQAAKGIVAEKPKPKTESVDGVVLLAENEQEEKNLADELKSVKYCVGPKELKTLGKQLKKYKQKLTFEHAINALIFGDFNLKISNLTREQKNALYALGHRIFERENDKKVEDVLKLRDYKKDGFCENYILSELRTILGMGGQQVTIDENVICLLNAYTAKDKAVEAAKKAMEKSKSNNEVNKEVYAAIDTYIKERCNTEGENEILARLYTDINGLLEGKFGENYVPVGDERVLALSYEEIGNKLVSYCLEIGLKVDTLTKSNKDEKTARAELENFIEDNRNLSILIEHETGADEKQRMEHESQYKKCKFAARERLAIHYKGDVDEDKSFAWLYVLLGVVAAGGAATGICLGTDACSTGNGSHPRSILPNTDPGDKTYK
ncbi:hypothetical protein KY339_02285 [Candidatus Woesearchaeota archaeon]|nr:hypothetical protein [Candidatus Woesearchaeota archaeon]